MSAWAQLKYTNRHCLVQEFGKQKQANFHTVPLCEFYPNITEDLLKRTLDYAKNYEKITAEEMRIIFQTKKSFCLRVENHGSRRETNLLMFPWDPGMEHSYVI